MNLRKMLLPALVLLVAMLLAGPAAAQEPAIANASAGLIVENPDGLTVGDPIQLRLEVQHPAGTQAILPQLPAEWAGFVVRQQSAPVTTTKADGRLTTSQSIDARLFAPGSFTTPPLTVSLSDAAGQLSELTAEPVSLAIQSVLIEGDTTLRDIKPQADLPLPAVWPWIVAAGLLVAAAVLIWRRRHSLKGMATVFDNRQPHEVALDELARIAGLRLPQTGRYKEHYTLASDCLRRYVENTYGVPAMERTTAEIQAGLKKASLDAKLSRDFASILNESDLVKFAKFTPDQVSAQLLLEDARAFVEATRPVVTQTAEVTLPISRNGHHKTLEVTA